MFNLDICDANNHKCPRKYECLRYLGFIKYPKVNRPDKIAMTTSKLCLTYSLIGGTNNNKQYNLQVK